MKAPIIMIGVGRDYCRDLDCEIYFGIRRLANPAQGERIYQTWVSVSWNWLPFAEWIYAAMPYFGEVWSRRWTGRDKTLHRWSWPFVISFRNRQPVE